MEQTTNFHKSSLQVAYERDNSAPWRSLGGLAAGLVAQAEAARLEAVQAQAAPMSPLAWAAE